jgi:hypothetical protein
MANRIRKLIDLDKNITDYTSRLIRKEVGVKSLKQLVDKAKEQGVNVGVRKDTQIKRSLKYFGGIYNERVEEENKKIEKKRLEEIKRKREQDTMFQGEATIEVEILEVRGGGAFTDIKEETTKKTRLIRTSTRNKRKEIDELLEDRIKQFGDSETIVSVKILKKRIRKIKRNETALPPLEQYLKWKGASNLEGLRKNEEWDTFQNLCVPDGLYNFYKNKKGYIKYVSKKGKPNYSRMEELGTTKDGEVFKGLIKHKKIKQIVKEKVHHNTIPKAWYDIDYIEKEVEKELLDYSCLKPNDNGWTIKNIALFCNNIRVNLYVLHNNELIFQIQDGKRPDPLIIEVKNNHIYFIEDVVERNKIVNRGKTQSDKKKQKEKKETKQELEIVELYNLYDSEEYTGEQMLLLECKKRNIMPYKSKINKVDDLLCPVKIDNTLFLFKDNHSYIVKQILGDDYEGQGIGYFCKDAIDKIPKSNFNPQVQDALFVDYVKRRIHSNIYPDLSLEEFNDKVIQNPKDYSCADINKHYRSCMYNPHDNFCYIDFKAEVKYTTKYNKNNFGLYYVKTDDKNLFHGNNWYSNKIIDFAIEEGIEFQVKYYIRGVRMKKDIMKNIIDELAEKYNIEYTDINGKKKIFSKLVINSLSGMLGRTKSKYSKLTIDQSSDNVWTYIKNNKDKDIYLDEIGVKDDKMFIYGEENNTELFQNRMPMYLQILDWSNIELYKMVKKLGGFENLIYRKTDCVIMKNNDLFDNYNFNKNIGDYDKEDNWENKLYYPSQYKSAQEPVKTNTKWIEHNDVSSSDDWEKILNIAELGGGVLCCGEAGSGKSYVIKQIAKKRKVMMCAFTNKASNNLIQDDTEDNSNISTIHKLLYGAVNDLKTMKKCMEIVKKYEILIIDEISMVSSHLISLITILKRYTDIPIMLFGDWKQLPPIEEGFDENTQFDFMTHSSIKYLTGNNYVYLQYNEKSRCDKKLRQFALDAYEYNADITELPIAKYNPEYPCICYTNNKRQVLNNIAQKYFANKSKKFQECPYYGEPSKYHQDILLFKGAKLLSNITNKDGTLLKNVIYEVVDWNETDLIVMKNDVPITTELKDIHKNFILGYVMTTHKSQGDTIDTKIQLAEIESMKDDNRLIYTALTRATNFENIVLV